MSVVLQYLSYQWFVHSQREVTISLVSSLLNASSRNVLKKCSSAIIQFFCDCLKNKATTTTTMTTTALYYSSNNINVSMQVLGKYLKLLFHETSMLTFYQRKPPGSDCSNDLFSPPLRLICFACDKMMHVGSKCQKNLEK